MTFRRVRWLSIVAVVTAVVVAIVALQAGGGTDRETADRDTTNRDTGAEKASPAVTVDQLRPLPRSAKGDRPDFYDDGSGCQVKDGDPEPKVCISGDETAERTVMLLGDSKIAQWETAYSELGRQQGFRVLTVTKSACPFTDAMVAVDDEPFTDCRAWGKAALQEAITARPDVVVTSQRASSALLDDGSDRTRGAMVRGLHSYWTQLQEAGTQVVVQLDNPFPATHPVYRCVEEHPTDFTRCDFDLTQGTEDSAAPMQKEAAQSLTGVGVLDMTSAICPDGGTCPAVIDDVLLYRAGSHLTRTFTVSVVPQLAAALEQALAGQTGATAP